MGTESPKSHRSSIPIAVIQGNSERGSESPRSLRDYHRGGTGTLTGGGVDKIFVSTKPSMKNFKRKLDARLGIVLLLCLVTIAVILGIYGVMHESVHDELTTYVNRTHQIAKELKNAMDENYPKENQTNIDKLGRRWMTVEELEDDAELIESTHSTLWCLFWWNILLSVLLSPVVIVVHCGWVEGNGAKIAYRVVIVIGLLFCVAQFLYLIHPIFWGAAKFPSMLDRLFMEAYPKDEYQLADIQSRFACEFHPHETLVKLDLQQPCLPKMKNSLLPTYSAVLLIFIDLFPFLYAIFTYVWSAYLKNSKVFKTARSRVELNNARRVPFPTHNVYSPPERDAKPAIIDVAAM
ncbi:unnamed protein product [Caenorhabditis auriculariae]|uniref:Uncharacterized protein n=1 Tax=Caenorhabditis auriculariae TaxID=2777116 RepID=A0A8S1H872_9PELO|nr:unnamed protein product [Caenorhabditis auriculariae]